MDDSEYEALKAKLLADWRRESAAIYASLPHGKPYLMPAIRRVTSRSGDGPVSNGDDMSEEKTRLPKLEMPRLSKEVLDRWSVTMEAAGKAIREFGDILRAAYPSIQQNMTDPMKSVQPPVRKQSDDE